MGCAQSEGKPTFGGYLALKVEDGAGYDFTTITGLTSISENDLFFNNYLQSLDLGGDKYLLFYQEDGDFEITLKEKAPFLWVIRDGLMDALDYNWITIGVVYAPISLAFLGFLIVILTIKLLKRKTTPREIKLFFAAGILFAGLHIGYTLLRMDKYTASADLVNFNSIDLLLGFCWIFQHDQRRFYAGERRQEKDRGVHRLVDRHPSAGPADRLQIRDHIHHRHYVQNTKYRTKDPVEFQFLLDLGDSAGNRSADRRNPLPADRYNG